jgi:hypothetical protein
VPLAVKEIAEAVVLVHGQLIDVDHVGAVDRVAPPQLSPKPR